MIIAVDFDGILCVNKFPLIGDPNYEVVSLMRQLRDKGHKIILWTCRIDDKLQEAIDWCADYGLHFDAVNDNIASNVKQYGTNPRKVYADVYIDDHNIEFIAHASLYDAISYIKYRLKKGVRTWITEEN